jgi:integrase
MTKAYQRIAPLAANDLAIKAAKPAVKDGKASQVEYRIDGVSGLTLRVEASGKAAFYMRYVANGATKRVRIGGREAMTWKDARSKALALASSVDQGEDPRAVQAAAQESPALRDAWEDRKKDNERAKGSDKRAASTFVSYDEAMKRVVFPVLGDVPVAKITREQLGVVLQKAKGKFTESIVHNARAGVGNLFKWLGRIGYVQADTARLVRTLHGIRKSETRDRTPTAEELGKLWNQCGVMIADNAAKHTTRQLATALRLMILVPQRNSEVLQAQLSEFHDLDGDKPVWRIAKARMKVKERDQSLALSREAVAVVKAAIAQGEKDRVHLFPSRDDPSKPFRYTSASAFMERLRNTLDIDGLNIHDFRRGWNDWAIGARVDKDVRDRVLHHASADVTDRNYTTVDYAELTRGGMQGWADHVLASAAAVQA